MASPVVSPSSNIHFLSIENWFELFCFGVVKRVEQFCLLSCAELLHEADRELEAGGDQPQQLLARLKFSEHPTFPFPKVATAAVKASPPPSRSQEGWKTVSHQLAGTHDTTTNDYKKCPFHPHG